MTDPTAYDYDLVCIGSGPAGQRGAVQAAKLGKRVALVERRQGLGGMCLETGTIPSKTFREAVVRLTALAEDAADRDAAPESGGAARHSPAGQSPPHSAARARWGGASTTWWRAKAR